MMLFIFFLLTIIIIIFLVSALILFGLTKLFKVQNATYKNSMKILLFFSIVSILVEQIFIVFKSLIDLNLLFVLIEISITFFVFHYLFKRYYQNIWKKSLCIYITFFILTIIFSLAVIMPTRHFLVEPFYVKGDKMSPTLIENDYLLTDKFNNNYQKGDIIIFNSQDQTEISIGRIIEFSDEADEYFVSEDNRKADSDSQISETINKKDIIGKVFLIIRDSKVEFVK